MSNLRSARTALAGLLLVSSSSLSWAASGGINSFSGNPATGGQICTACHSGGVVPTVTLSGPSSVLPNTITAFTLTISGGQEVAGGLDVSSSGGTVLAAGPGTQLLFGDVTHTEPRLADANGEVVFGFNWRSPSAPGTFTLYGAGLSANLGQGPNGDNAGSDTLIVDVLSATATPGEASGTGENPLRVTGVDPLNEQLTIGYDPACASTSHHIYYGPLDQVAAYVWSGQVCDIGASGFFDGFDPGPGSFFFVVVGRDSDQEGSYGRSLLPDGETGERPAAPSSPCGTVQSLADPCDAAP